MGSNWIGARNQGSWWSMGLSLGSSYLLPHQHILGFFLKVDDPSRGHIERRIILDRD